MADKMEKTIALNMMEMFHAEFDKNNCTSLFDHKRIIRNRVPGNELLADIFKTLPGFDQACREVKRSMAYPQVPVILEAVRELYEINGETADFDEKAQRSLAACLRNWLGGQNRVRRANLSDSKRCLWIDVFAALNMKFRCFSDDNTDFSVFLARYAAFISEVDNTALVGISPRSLSDVCEAYCVFMGKHQAFYKDMLGKLRAARENAEESSAPDYGQTSLIKLDIINYFVDAHETSPEKMVDILCEYVSRNPERFDIECYFCTMCDMLITLNDQGIVTSEEIGADLYSLFTDLNGSFEAKTQNLTKLKKALFEAIVGNYNGTNKSVAYAKSVICVSRYEGFEGAVHSVLTLLRFAFIVGTIAKYEATNSRRAMNYRDSADKVVAEINNGLRDMEVSTLGIAPNRTLGRELDDTVFMYLKNNTLFK